MNDRRKASADDDPSLFVIALFDETDPNGTTVHTFADPALWEWIHRQENFPDGVEALDLPIPGTALFAYVSRWEPELDKAQHLVCLPGQNFRSHPSITVQPLGPSDALEFRSAFADLCAQAGSERCFLGRW